MPQKYEFQTLRNNVQQGVQTDATCSIQQCWVRLQGAVDSVTVFWLNSRPKKALWYIALTNKTILRGNIIISTKHRWKTNWGKFNFSGGKGGFVEIPGVVVKKRQSPDFRSPEVGISALEKYAEIIELARLHNLHKTIDHHTPEHTQSSVFRNRKSHYIFSNTGCFVLYWQKA